MKFLCLGGAGRICREAILDLVQFCPATRITLADIDESAAISAAGRREGYDSGRVGPNSARSALLTIELPEIQGELPRWRSAKPK